MLDAACFSMMSTKLKKYIMKLASKRVNKGCVWRNVLIVYVYKIPKRYESLWETYIFKKRSQVFGCGIKYTCL